MRLRTLLPAFALLLLGAACSDDVVSPTFGNGCEAGDIRPGDVITSALHEGSCRVAYNFYSGYSTPYVSYSVHLEAGKAYLISQEAVPDDAREGRNGLDPLLALFGRDANGVSIPLAVSDDQGFASNSEIFFVAPKTGDYQLLAMSYRGADNISYLGGFRLAMAQCPVIGRSTGADTLAVTLEPSDCRRATAGRTAPFTNAPADYRFVSIKVAPHEQVGVRVTADGFTPAWELFGPGFDVYANLDGTQYYHLNANGEQIITSGDEGGYITLAIGALGPSSSAPTATVAIRRINVM